MRAGLSRSPSARLASHRHADGPNAGTWYQPTMPAAARFESPSCNMIIEELASGVVQISIEGTDIGQLGEAPFRTLARLLVGDHHVELFIDARNTRSVSMDVSGDWALWLGR